MRLGLTFAFVVALFVPGTIGTAEEAKPSCADDAMLVFDASGSMAATDFPDGAPSRFDRVRQALNKVVPSAAQSRRLGLIVYGPGRKSDTCQNVDLRLTPTPNAGDLILGEVEGLRPQGRTALTASVRQAAEVLHHSVKPAVIVALTDGQDTCGGDACLLARELKNQRPAITVHVVGYRLTPMTAPSPTPFVERCLADETGGIFATAETADELASALAETLGCPAVTSLPPQIRARLAGHGRALTFR
ncbi:MAG: VWA domain-containing protein [Hyphomicrobium sp.]|uniref:vWA domain-containing protein n=1 Tax=Hyphomicrobium sp. TaxID=82 RepID=UPI003D0F2AFF